MKKLLIFALSCVCLQLYAQVQPGTYTIKTKLVNRNMDVQWGNNANGTLLHLWDVNENKAQNFTIENSNEAGYYYIKTAWGRVLDVYNSDRSSGAKLNTWDFNGSDAQKWKFVNTGDGYYNIQSKLGTYIDVKGGASEGGTLIWMSAYSNWNGNIAQRWKLDLILKKILKNPPFYINNSRKSCVDWPTRDANRPRPNCNNCTQEPLTAVNAKMWATGSTLRVNMKGGSTFIRRKVQQYANEWSNYANIRFNFVNGGESEIIITFGEDGKSYSKIGTDAIDPWFRIGAGTGIVPNETMHFGWFTDTTNDEEFRRVVLHEFGHALGFIHEHQNPVAGIPWNREAVYINYAGSPNNWSREEVDRNLFEKYNRNQTQFTQYDRTSIMHYPIDPSETIGGFSVGLNNSLSATDIAFARVMYPPGVIRGSRLKITTVTGGDNLRVNSQAYLSLKLRVGPLREMQISLNNGSGWDNHSTNMKEVAMPDGVSIGDVTECKVIFQSGKQFPWDDVDKWNMDRIKIEWLTPENFSMILSEQSGSPLIRFDNTGHLSIFNR